MPKPGWFLNLKGNPAKTAHTKTQMLPPVWKLNKIIDAKLRARNETKKAELKKRTTEMKNRMAEYLSSASGGIGVNRAGMINVLVGTLAKNNNVTVRQLFEEINRKTGLSGTAIHRILEQLREGGFIATNGWKPDNTITLLR